MLNYLLRRAVFAAVAILGLITIVFFVTRIIGDPARLILPPSATPAEYEALKESMGLNRPVLEQFAEFLGKMVTGDFGISIWQQVPAIDLVGRAMLVTAILSIVTIIVATLIAVPLGTLAGMRPNSIADRLTSMFSMAAISVPTPWLGLTLILVFAVNLGWVRTSGYVDWTSFILPVATLAVPATGHQAAIVRAAVLEQLSSDYVITAKAKGASTVRILRKHVFKNAAIPFMTVLGDDLANLLAGSVVVEVIFGWPGIGQLTIQAIERRDFPLIQAAIFTIGIIVLLINTLIDLTYPRFDPRVKLGQR